MLIILVRTVILYLLIIFGLRIMGKRQIGELQPSELVVAIIISELAAIPMGDVTIPLLHGIFPILILIISEIFLAYLTLKNRKIRNIIAGKPSILIENGNVNEEEMEKLRLNIDDLNEELRLNNMPDIKDVQFAILETSGQLSIIPKPEKQPVSAEDMQLSKENENYPIMIISDGKIDFDNLRQANYDENWLNEQLKKQRINNVKDVFIAYIDKNDNFIYQLKDTYKEETKG